MVKMGICAEFFDSPLRNVLSLSSIFPGLSSNSLVLIFSGLRSLEEVADLDPGLHPVLSLNLDEVTRGNLQTHVTSLQQSLILKYWLEEHHLVHYYDR